MLNQDKPTLHFALMCNRSNGGFASALTLINALKKSYEVIAWSLYGELYPGHAEIFTERGVPLKMAEPVVHLEPGEHLFFYMNDYPRLFGNYSDKWRLAMQSAASVQIAFNRTLGAIPREAWLAEYLRLIYFQDARMQSDWKQLVQGSPLEKVASEILSPPVVLNPFLELKPIDSGPMVFGRLAGDGAVSETSVELYERLASACPQAEFWFMPAPFALQKRFGSDSQFRFFEPNQIEVPNFLQACDIFLLTYDEYVPVPGPRSLVEAMAAGCAPVVINRDGPMERVVHGESGYCASNDDEFFAYAHQLATDPDLRRRISVAARSRARTFRVEDWVEKIDRSAACTQ